MRKTDFALLRRLDRKVKENPVVSMSKRGFKKEKELDIKPATTRLSLYNKRKGR